MPDERQERALQGRGQGQGTVSGALPDTHSQGPPEVQVEEVLHLMCDLKAEAFSDHHMPGGAELLVHRLFDHLGGALEHRGRCHRGAGGRRTRQLPLWEAEVLAGERPASLLSLFCSRNHQRVSAQAASLQGPLCRERATRCLTSEDDAG